MTTQDIADAATAAIHAPAAVPDLAPAPACPDCGAYVATAYCGDCGQRQPRPGDFSWQAFAADGWSEFSGSDSRLWRTLRAMFMPGALTRAFLDYRWQSFLPPLRLYLIAAGLFFLFGWDAYYQASVEQVLAIPGLAPAVRVLYTDPETSAHMGDITGVLKFLSVLAMAAWVALLCVTRERPLGAHLVFALHFTTIDFVMSLLLAPLMVLAAPGQEATVSTVVLAIDALVLGIWAVVGIRRVYGTGWIGSGWRGLLVLLADIFMSFLCQQAALVWLLLRAPALPAS